MPRLRKETVHHRTPMGTEFVELQLSVTTNGTFYCPVPAELAPYFEWGQSYLDGKVQCGNGHRENALKIQANRPEWLLEVARLALRSIHDPVSCEEHVIRYIVESEVSFAENENGEIAPNAGYEGFNWPAHEDRQMYGLVNSLNQVPGYRLTIGARALTKKTISIGDKQTVQYSNYYAGGHHLGKENWAQRLNSWCSLSLPEHAKEIPYTDEAAKFFFDLMMGMARLSQMIQNATFDQSDLLQAISAANEKLISFSDHPTPTQGEG